MLMFDIVVLEKKTRWIIWMLFRNEPIYLVRFRRPFWTILLLWTNFNTSRARMVRNKTNFEKMSDFLLVWFTHTRNPRVTELSLILPRQFSLLLWFAINYTRLVEVPLSFGTYTKLCNVITNSYTIFVKLGMDVYACMWLFIHAVIPLVSDRKGLSGERMGSIGKTSCD